MTPRRCHLLLMLMTCLVTRSTTAWVARTSSTCAARRNHSALSMSSITISDDAAPNLLSLEECLQLAKDDSNNNNNKKNVVFVDGTWFHKGTRSGREEFEQGPRICGAHYLDPVDIATTREMFPLLNKQGLWAMLPTADLFALTMDEFGIANGSHVVVYGKEGALFTPRTWFMFKHFGHQTVSLMQASLEEWMDAGGAVDTDRVQVPYAKDILLKAKSKRPSYQCSTTIRNDVVDIFRMKQLVGNDNAIIIDPRSSSFSKGHMPGAYNIPYSSLVQEDNALKLKSKEKLFEIFEKAGVDIYDTSKDIVASCGSGVSACTVMLALEECGRTDNTFMYDGSWQEWKLDPTTPKVLPADQ